MQAPYDMDAPLQVICYLKHKKSGDTTLEAAVDLDKKLGGAPLPPARAVQLV